MPELGMEPRLLGGEAKVITITPSDPAFVVFQLVNGGSFVIIILVSSQPKVESVSLQYLGAAMSDP